MLAGLGRHVQRRDIEAKIGVAAGEQKPSLRIVEFIPQHARGVSGGVEDLAELLIGCTSALIGQSGVGKSSLLNAVDPSLGLKVGWSSSLGPLALDAASEGLDWRTRLG